VLLPQNKTTLTSRATEDLVAFCTNLRHLVGYVPFASPKQIQLLHATHHKTLRSLSVHVVEERRVGSGGGRLGCDILRSLLPDFVALELLDLTVPRLRDGDLRAILGPLALAAANLRVIKLSHCTNLTDEAFNWNNILMDTQGQAQEKTQTRTNTNNNAATAAAANAESTQASYPPAVAAAPATSVSASAPVDGASNAPQARPPRVLSNKPSFGAFVAASAAAAPTAAPAVSAAGPSASALAYFSPHSIGWSCSIELVYLSHCPCVSSRTLLAFAQLPSVRYVDAAACEMLCQEERRIHKIQTELRAAVEAGTRQPLTLAVHI
jgi:hypothetical protein